MRRGVNATVTPEERQSFDFNAPTVAILPEFEAAAKEHEGKSSALPILAWIAQNTSRFAPEGSKSAIDTLLSNHVTSADFAPAIRPIAGLASSLGKDKVFTMLSTVVEMNKNPEVLAQALYSRANLFIGYRTEGSDEQLKQALTDFKGVIATTTDAKLRQRAKGKIYEYENLNVGCEAPEVSGTERDGVSFKASDYRGEIVFLDFWGNR